MKYYIAADGGGTKLQAVLYDETLHVINTARVSGVNSNFKLVERIAAEMHHLAAELIPEDIDGIENVTLSVVGDGEMLLDALKSRRPVRNCCYYGEGEVALAAAGVLYGVVAQAGTGSDAFLVQPGFRDAVGGWGAVLGDEGGGYDLGIRTLKAAIYAYDGRGPKTVLLEMLMEKWNLSRPWDMIERLVRNPDSRELAASATYLTAEAAGRGDEVALKLYEDAAHELSLQVLTLLRRHGGIWEGPIVASGGTWKGCGRMFDTFREDIWKVYPDAVVDRPFADPVVGCAIRQRMAEGEQFRNLKDMIEEEFAPFLLKGLFPD